MVFDKRYLLASVAIATCAVTTSCNTVSENAEPRGSVAAAPSQSSIEGAAMSDEGCVALSGLRLENVEIVSAKVNAEGAKVEGASLFGGMEGNPSMGPPVQGLPAFCRVIGKIRPEAGSEITFETWLPAKGWDGRFSGVGIGGFAGSIDYLGLSAGMKAGQAVLTTDTGHTGSAQDGSWAKGRPERVTDYAWRAFHLSTVASKKLVASYYGRGPDHSYFVGCSGGGRQGLIAASRFPEDYDGILAGAPAAGFTELVIGMVNTIQAQMPQGAALRPKQIPLLQAEIVGQCDRLDGAEDGLIEDPRQCKPDLSKLACGTNGSDQCFSPPQIQALARIHAGPHDSRGRQLVGGYLPSGSEVGTPLPMLGWESYLLNEPGRVAAADALARGILQHLIQKPFATPEDFDFDTDPAKLRASDEAQQIDARPDLRAFFARGGKLILWHGWADAAIPPESTLKWHDAMLRSSGAPAADQSRLFMVPGVQHCFGGTGPNSFGQSVAPLPSDKPEDSLAAALQSWVEDGRKPEKVVGRFGMDGFMGMPKTGSGKERLICVYPKKTILKPGADPAKGESYSCT